MVFSYYIYNIPYRLLWHAYNYLGRTVDFAFYCADPLDYDLFLPIAKYLPKPIYIAKNSKTRNYLEKRGLKCVSMPAFPKVVIMGRQTPYKFPVDEIIKFGFDHGLYQFKRWTAAENYNGFNMYFVSSEKQVEIAEQRGIRTVTAVGYPKLDNAFNGTYDKKYLDELRKILQLNPTKKTVLFTTTWDVAGLSAIDKWIDNLESLSDDFNILVTVHTWTKQRYKSKLKSMNYIKYIEQFDVTPYLMLADVMVGDYSSIIGEFCAFDKPIITFKVKESDRTILEILTLIRNISVQIENFDEIHDALRRCIYNPDEKQDKRREAIKILFYKLDGKAGKRAADYILETIRKLDQSFSNGLLSGK